MHTFIGLRLCERALLTLRFFKPSRKPSYRQVDLEKLYFQIEKYCQKNDFSFSNLNLRIYLVNFEKQNLFVLEREKNL